jgi:nicotinate-nucleotide--dimethylbenzimidazole phosphoribosyltransferase
MSEAELDRALQAGWDRIDEAAHEGVQIVALGEMGIGNTTPAAAVIAALLNCSAAEVTGRGTGVDDAGLKLKIKVIDEAITFHKNELHSSLILATTGQ